MTLLSNPQMQPTNAKRLSSLGQQRSADAQWNVSCHSSPAADLHFVRQRQRVLAHRALSLLTRQQLRMFARAGPILILSLVPYRASAQSGADLDSLDRYVRAERARQRIPGLAVAVLRGDSVLVARGYGYANVEHHVPATDSTVFEVGSISKQFTSAAIVLLAEKGRLGLDDAITRYLPEGSAVWPGVTVRHLLTHTSGISDQSLDSIDWRKDYTEEELVRLAAAQPLLFGPGENESYSGTGYTLLGIIIHRVTGQFYGDFIRDHIFLPLDMGAARVNSDAAVVPNRSAGYYFDHGTLKNRDWTSASLSATADRGLCFSARDLVQWAIALNHGKPLGRDRLEASWSPVRLNNGWTYPYGLGWQLTQQRGFRRIGHSGAWGGFQGTIQRYPDFGLTVIVLTNLDEANPEGIASGIAGILEPVLTPPHLLPGRLPGASPPKALDGLLRDVAASRDSAEVTPGMRALTPPTRRERIARLLKGLQAWTFVGCEDVAGRHMSRVDSRIRWLCYGKGPIREGEREGNVVVTVLYGAGWRAAGIDLYFF
jgi:CubicO group peptidase (beta-lactamase class C family)